MKCIIQDVIISYNKLGHLNDTILMHQSSLLLVPLKALDIFTNNISLYDLHNKSNGTRVLKSCDMLPHSTIPIKICLDQCFSSSIMHKNHLGILLKCRFLFKWDLRFWFLKKPLDDVDAFDSESLLGIAAA